MSAEQPSNEPPPRSGSLRVALTNLGWLLGSRGIAAVLSLGYIAIIARTLGPAGFGQFALITGISSSIVAIVGFQTWQIIVRFGMDHMLAGRDTQVARLILSGALLDLVSGVAGSLIALAAVMLLAPVFGWPDGVKWSAWLFATVMLLAVRSVGLGVLRLYDRYDLSARVETVPSVARMAGALIVYATGPSVVAFLAAWAAAELVAFAFGWWAALGATRHLRWRLALLDWQALREENPGLVPFAATTSGSQTFRVSSREAPVLLVGMFASPAAAGGFRLAHQLGRAMALVSQLFARALFPELMRIKAGAARAQQLSGLLRRITLGSAVVGVVIVLLLLFAGRPMIALIAGPAFLAAYPLLLLLGFAAVIDLIAVGFEPALVASGHAGRSLRIQALCAIALMVMLVLFLQKWGAVGGGIAVLAGSALNAVLMAIAAFRAIKRMPVSPETSVILRGEQEDVERTEAVR